MSVMNVDSNKVMRKFFSHIIPHLPLRTYLIKQQMLSTSPGMITERSQWWSLHLRMQKSTAKNYHPASLLSVVSKFFEKLVNNRIVRLPREIWSFFWFARFFNRSQATQAVALDISKAFDRVSQAGLFYKLKSYGIWGQIFGLISSFLSNRRLQVFYLLFIIIIITFILQ